MIALDAYYSSGIRVSYADGILKLICTKEEYRDTKNYNREMVTKKEMKNKTRYIVTYPGCKEEKIPHPMICCSKW